MNYDSKKTNELFAESLKILEINKNDYGLKTLPVYETAGLIWAIVNPKSTVDIQSFLAGYDKMLETFAFSEWVYVSKRTFSGPNWKIAYDGYLEYYHVPVLHRETFGVDATNRGPLLYMGTTSTY